MTDSVSKKVILHAGAYKTATSTVQTILGRNADHMLAHLGVLYPKSGRRLNTGSSDPASLAHHPFCHAVRAQQVLPAKGAKLKRALAREVSEAPVQTVVISTELITSAPPSEKRALLDLIADRVEDVSVIYAFRRPDEYLDSMLNQSLKNGRTDRVRAAGQRLGRDVHKVPFLQDVRQWHSILGPERVRVVYFSKQAYPRYLEKVFGFVGVGLSDPLIDAKVHDNSAVTQVGYLLRKLCFDRLAQLDHTPTRLDRHHLGIELDALESRLATGSHKMIMFGTQDRQRVLDAQQNDMAQMAAFLDEEDRDLLKQDMARGVAAGLIADDPDAPVALSANVLGSILAGLCQGHLRQMLQY